MLHDWQGSSFWSITARGYWFSRQSELLITVIKCQKLSEFKSYDCNLLFQKLCGGRFSSDSVWQGSALGSAAVHREWCDCFGLSALGLLGGREIAIWLIADFSCVLLITQEGKKKESPFLSLAEAGVLYLVNTCFKQPRGLLKSGTESFLGSPNINIYMYKQRRPAGDHFNG